MKVSRYLEAPEGKRWRWKFEPMVALGSSVLFHMIFRYFAGHLPSLGFTFTVGALVMIVLGFRLEDLDEPMPLAFFVVKFFEKLTEEQKNAILPILNPQQWAMFAAMWRKAVDLQKENSKKI